MGFSGFMSYSESLFFYSLGFCFIEDVRTISVPLLYYEDIVMSVRSHQKSNCHHWKSRQMISWDKYQSNWQKRAITFLLGFSTKKQRLARRISWVELTYYVYFVIMSILLNEPINKLILVNRLAYYSYQGENGGFSRFWISESAMRIARIRLESHKYVM